MIAHAPNKRLLNKEEAATYCGLGPSAFVAHCPVPGLRLGSKTRWDIRALDRWIDEMSNLGKPPRSGAELVVEAFGDADETEKRP